jgi:transketolase
LIEAQDETYRARVMGPEGTVRVACEAASGFGWERWLGSKGTFIGMTGFGASGKAPDLFKHFGITAEAMAQAARRLAQ